MSKNDIKIKVLLSLSAYINRRNTLQYVQREQAAVSLFLI